MTLYDVFILYSYEATGKSYLYCQQRLLASGAVLFIVLVLYVPGQQLWSWRDGQPTLSHFFLGKLEQAVMHIFSLVTDNNPS